MKKFTLMMLVCGCAFVATSQAQFLLKAEFSLDDYNIVRTVDTIQISCDNPEYFYIDDVNKPEVPFKNIIFPTNYNPYEEPTICAFPDIAEIEMEDIYMNIYLYANTPATQPGDPLPLRVINTGHTFDALYQYEEEIINGFMQYKLTFTPFIYDNYEKKLSFVKSVTFGIAATYCGNNGYSSIENLSTPELESVTYYDLSGRQVQTPSRGVNIKVTEYVDGTRKTEKKIIR